MAWKIFQDGGYWFNHVPTNIDFFFPKSTNCIHCFLFFYPPQFLNPSQLPRFLFHTHTLTYENKQTQIFDLQDARIALRRISQIQSIIILLAGYFFSLFKKKKKFLPVKKLPQILVKQQYEFSIYFILFPLLYFEEMKIIFFIFKINKKKTDKTIFF